MHLLSHVALICLHTRLLRHGASSIVQVHRLGGVRCASYTLNSETSCFEVVKKSKFITHVAPAASFEDAMRFLERIKDDKANHNCWAYRSATTSRCSDDGEPGGTAGRPILGILETEEIVDAMVVVTRHFGGIKLGSGGLVRAYGGAAKAGVLKAGKTIVVPHTTVKLTVPSEDIGAVYNLLQSSHVNQSGEGAQYKKLSEDFVIRGGDAGQGEEIHSVEFAMSIPTSHIDHFKQTVSSICKGKESLVVGSELENQ